MSAQQCHKKAAEHGGARSLSDEGSDSNAKRSSLAALRLAAPSYASIFGQISELAVCNTLAQTELELAIALCGRCAALVPVRLTHGSPLDAIAAQRCTSAIEDEQEHNPNPAPISAARAQGAKKHQISTAAR